MRLESFRRGFTLIELIVVMTIIATLAAIAVPQYQKAILRSRESTLRSNLLVIRSALEEFSYDKHKPAQSLDELVSEGYLHRIPDDPITRSNQTWKAAAEEGGEGISTVFSGSDKTSLEGTPYSKW